MENSKVCVKKFHVSFYVAPELRKIHGAMLLVDVVLVEDVRCVLLSERAHIAIGNLVGHFLSLKLYKSTRILIIL